LITRIISGEYRLLSSSLCSFLHSPLTSSLLGQNIPTIRIILIFTSSSPRYAFVTVAAHGVRSTSAQKNPSHVSWPHNNNNTNKATGQLITYFTVYTLLRRKM
jgi:hypothetical protein